MNRKWLVFSIIAVFIVAIGVTTALAKSGFNLDLFKKEIGVKQIQEGVQVDLPSNKDKQAVVDSIDPKTGRPMIDLQAKAGNKETLKKHLVAEDTGKKLDVPYVKNGSKDVAIYDPITTLQTIPLPGTNDYLIDFDGTIYRADWANGILKKFLKDEVGGYKKEEILSHHLEEVGTPLWATLPVLNPSGTYLLFYSERSKVTGDKNGETWIKNISTGDERPVMSASGQVLGWLNDTTVVYKGINIVSINVETGDVKTLLGDGNMVSGLIKNQLVYQADRGTLTFQSVETGEKTTITSKLLYDSGTYQAQGEWLAMVNHMNVTDSELSIVLYNIDSKVWKVISPANNQLINGYFWQDDSTLLIQTNVKGSLDETTYTVNINELEDAL